MFIKNVIFWLCAATWLVLDQVTKYAIAQNANLHDFPVILGVFHLRYITNSGAAFSLFSGASGGWLKWVSLGVSIALIWLASSSNQLNRWEQAGYGCILGGALGNGLDRFISGAVTDFLDFRLIRFPVFNFADIAINVGLVCLLISVFSTHKRKDNSS